MDKNVKFLKRLGKGEFHRVLEALEKIYDGKTENLDIKKLTGHNDLFRVRVGTIRIIFLAGRNNTEILEISRRSDTTYNEY